jgi:2-dehydropantoate 2-reductase
LLAITTPDIWSYLWGKLGYSAMMFAQALGQKGIADCLARPELLPLWRRLGEAAALQSVAAVAAFNSTSAETHSGVWRDLAIRKRSTEPDVQIAPIAEIGARHGIDYRATRKLVEMIHEVEEGRRAMTDDNLLELAQTIMAGRDPAICRTTGAGRDGRVEPGHDRKDDHACSGHDGISQ